MCLIDCGINPDQRMDAHLHGCVIDDGGAIADRIRVVDHGSLIGELIERDADGEFRCVKKLKAPDAF